ncbi:MAG: tetratricopeptide repeat protein [Xanthobacteraceae bacterium]
MSDVFREINEEVRREKLLKLWERYQNYIVTGMILLVLLIAGWRLYQWWEAKKAAEVGAAFNAAMTLSTEGKRAEAETAFAKIAESNAAGYRDLARLQAAAELAQRDPKAAVEAYDVIAADQQTPQTMRDLAAVRAGALLADSEPYATMLQRLEPLTAADRTYRNVARELLTLSAWRAGDATAARKWADMITGDAQATPNLRRRIEMLLALTAANAKS